MHISTRIPPHLERFVHQQIAAGSYHSEDEVVRAALHLLEDASFLGTAGARRAPTAPDGARPQPRTALSERWLTPAEWPVGPITETSPPRRSPRGLLADLRSDLSSDDVRLARDELWSGLHPGGA